ncbi:hypothetical protein RMATCC62417_18200 [Rhizopus microsporus]|nr:hypothetical protein RMATCC62417_18200 [Rhizopus microsporus]
MKVMKMAVKQRKVLSSSKGKEALDFTPRHLHSSSYGAPFISKPAAQFQSIPSTSKGKSKEVPLHRPPSSIMNKLHASNPASEVSAVTSAASNKPAATNIKVPMSKVEDEEPEEGKIVDSSPPHKIQQACSSHVNMPSYFKPNEAHDNESLSDSMAKDIPANFTVAPTKRVLSAIAPNTSTMEQFKIFTIMFCNLAYTYKQWADGEQVDLVFALSHLHALCNYIVSYYYKEKQNPDAAPSESAAAWKSLLPLGDMFLAKLQAQEQYLLYGICLRLMAMVRFRIFSKMQDEVRGALVRHLEAPSVSGDHQHVKMSCDLLEEYEQAMAMNTSSEKYFNYGVMASKLPSTFKQVCVDGNLLSGITIGEEAGVQASAVFPFHVNASLLHGAICTKCILSEFVSSIELDFTLIDDTDDYM